MKQLLLIFAMLVLGGGCEENPNVVPLTAEESVDLIDTVIRGQLKKPEGELTKADLAKVTMLIIKRRRLTNVSGLAGLKQLEVLGLDGNNLSDVSGLEGLTQLETLWLSGNQLTDVSGLAGLKQLKQLYLYGNQLTDVSGLAGLTQLETLYLHNNPDLTKAEIDKLQKALPKCKIKHTARE